MNTTNDGLVSFTGSVAEVNQDAHETLVFGHAKPLARAMFRHRRATLIAYAIAMPLLLAAVDGPVISKKIFWKARRVDAA